MKKFLVALGSAFLFVGSLSAQITLKADSFLIHENSSVFGKDEVRTIVFDSLLNISSRNFETSSNLGYTNTNFDGFGGAFTWDSTFSVHSGQQYITPDSSGFLIMDSEDLGVGDTQRVYLTSASFSTVQFNKLKVTISHHYNYTVNDSAADLMISRNGTTWYLIKSFSADAMDHGSPTSFSVQTFNIPDSFLGQPNVQVRLVYATTDGGQWAIDRITVAGNKYNPGYAFFKPGGAVAKTWDLSNINYDGGYRYYVRKAAPSPYRFIDSIYNEDLMALQHTTYGLNYFTSDGIIAHAHLTYGQELYLNAFTGMNDTLNIPVQFHLPYVKTPIPYSAFHIKYSFPMTYNSKWNSDYSFKSQFFLKGQSFNFSSGDKFLTCYRKAHLIQKDTVVGHGQMRVKDVNGVVQKYVNVLQLKTVITQVDSFWADTTGLITAAKTEKWNAFMNFMNNYSGFNGNTRTRSYTTISFVRTGAIHPMATVFLQDTFVTKIEIDANHPWILGVEETTLASGADVTVYPNPVSGRLVNIDIPNAADGKWNCQVLNMLGQPVSSQALDLGKMNNHSAINIPSVVSPGIYYLHITKDGATFAVKPVEVVN